jgi:carbon storage regulator
MLILSRRAGDAIRIGDEIRVVILSADRRGVRVGIEAPHSVTIVREEILAQVTDENRRASEVTRDNVVLRLIGAHPPGPPPDKS